mgnify:CR=1 FL=1
MVACRFNKNSLFCMKEMKTRKNATIKKGNRLEEK